MTVDGIQLTDHPFLATEKKRDIKHAVMTLAPPLQSFNQFN